MTDARFPERWLNDRRIVRLPAADFRAFVEALVLCVANRTDGEIRRDDLELARWLDADAARRLTVAELLSETSSGWLVLDYSLTQSTAAQMDAAERLRLYERDKKARQRAHQKDVHSLCTPNTCSQVSPGTSLGTVPGDRDRDKRGQDRPGQEQQLQDRESTEVCSWCKRPDCVGGCL